ncbi:hypothetical protein Droror1_Dr00025735 [Drosera rotundifolia]
MLEVSDQMYAANFLAFENSNPPAMAMEDSVGTFQEATRSTSLSALGSYTPAASTVEFEHIMKEEALMTFAPEYGAVETLSDYAQPKGAKHFHAGQRLFTLGRAPSRRGACGWAATLYARESSFTPGSMRPDSGSLRRGELLRAGEHEAGQRLFTLGRAPSR